MSFSPEKPRPRALYQYDHYWKDRLFSAEDRAALSRRLRLDDRVYSESEVRARGSALLSEVEVLITGWGAATLDAALLDRMPKLRAVFYAAGSVKGLVGDGECFERGVTVVSANQELARSVAEHTLGLVLVSLKNVWSQAATMRRFREGRRQPGPGAHASIVGLVGYGAIARALRALLRPFSVRVAAYDPYVDPLEAERENVELWTLERLFADADVVSCHLPVTGETRGLLREAHFRALKPGATFINTARGCVVAEKELLQVLRERPDVWAVLDVLDGEENGISASHPAYDLENVTLTPHIAGCLGPELMRLGHFVADEVDRWSQGRALRGQVEAALLDRSA